MNSLLTLMPIVVTIVCVMLLAFSLITLYILKNKNTFETIEKETEARKSAKNIKNSSFQNRFFRSRTNKMVLGICGGLAEYFNIDPVLTRIGTVLLALITAAFPLILVYVICGIIIPLEPEKPITNN
ncbi:MAG: hypothetical protein A2231_08355 [Candidatus Firestonebacteria bacterium RIFOXYA2_FULL_40_8]|nr:MAG: hypothetical protein A2231_08355 [Candidatus Firestonebacteria bacterium RIFOXYA2_FULL_40_8]